MSEERILEITVPKFARTYGNTAPKYFTVQDGVPGVYSRLGKKQKDVPQKYYKKPERYKWVMHPNGKVTMMDMTTREYVVANPNLANKGHQIKGQMNNTGQVHSGIRSQIFKAVKASCAEAIRSQSMRIPAEWYPLRIDIQLYDIIGNPFTQTTDPLKDKWDCDNFVSPYMKIVLDQLVNQGWVAPRKGAKKVFQTIDPNLPHTLVDDDRMYVSLPLCYWRPLSEENHDKRYMKIVIRPDETCHKHPLFMEFHGRGKPKPQGQFNFNM